MLLDKLNDIIESELVWNIIGSSADIALKDIEKVARNSTLRTKLWKMRMEQSKKSRVTPEMHLNRHKGFLCLKLSKLIFFLQDIRWKLFYIIFKIVYIVVRMSTNWNVL